MALKKILDIEIDPKGAFKSFQESYSKFVAKVEKMPAALAGAAKGAKGVAEAFATTLSTSTGQLATLDKQVGAQRRISAESKSVDYSWKSVARSSGAVANNIKGATSNLLRWAGAGAIFAGSFSLVSLGMDRMAAAVSASRRSATGLGLGIGQSTAFTTTFGRLVNPSAFLGGVATGRGDLGSAEYGALAALGVDRRGNTADTAMDALSKIYEMARRTDESMLGTMSKAFGLESFGIGSEEMRRLKGMSPEEFERYRSDYGKLSGQANIADADAKVFQDFHVKLQAAGDKIWATFVKALTPLAKPLSDLAEAFSDLVNSLVGSDGMRKAIEWLTAGFKDFAAYVNTPQFKQDIKDLVDNFVALAKATGNFLRFIGALPGNPGAAAIPQAPSKGIGSNNTSTMGPLGALYRWFGNTFGKSGAPVRTLPDGTPIIDTPPRDPAKGILGGIFGASAPGNNLFGMRPVGASTGFQSYATQEVSVVSASNNLLAYQNKLGLNTIRQIISRWAPPSENDTEKYIKQMVAWTRFAADQKLDLNDTMTRATILSGIARKEQGNIISPQQLKLVIENNTGGSAVVSSSQLAPSGFPQ